MKKIGLNNNQLKIIAMVTMLIDHIGYLLFPSIKILGIIGRISFPIFAFMIAEGYFYTRKKSNYFLNIFLLGIFCQAVFFIAERSLYLNILLTFSLSIVCLFLVKRFRDKKNFLNFLYLISVIFSIAVICFYLPKMLSQYYFEVDYGFFGVMLPVCIYIVKNFKLKIAVTAVILTLISLFTGGVQWFSYLALPFLWAYNGKRGKYNLKLLFYLFYPLHFLILYIIQFLVW